MKKWKFDESKKLYENVELLASWYGLYDDIKECISDISKRSYIAGSHDCFNSFKGQRSVKNDVDKILSFNFGKETDCPLCHGAGFYSFSTFGGETTATQKCSCGA